MVLMSLNNDEKTLLRDIAEQSIEYSLPHPHEQRFSQTLHLDDFPASLQNPGASFVTLEINKQLRGCIGTLQAHDALVLDVANNARAAAYNDPRFPPLTEKEFSLIDIHISVLSEPQGMSFHSEQDLINQLRPGIDGLILESAGHKGTFLPSVWESLHEPKQFFTQLKYKAGLPGNYWSNDLRVSRYTCEYF